MAADGKSLHCDTCKDTGLKKDAVVFCAQCQEFYCQKCYDCHRKLKATRSHHYAKFRQEDPGIVCSCDACQDGQKIAETICTDCRELLCKSCSNLHGKFKETKNHSILKLYNDNKGETRYAKEKEFGSATHRSIDAVEGSDLESLGRNRSSRRTPVNLESESRYRSIKPQPYSRQIDSPSKAVIQSTFLVRSSTDKNECQVDRLLSFPNGRIVIIDKGNKKLKLFSSDYVILDEIIASCSAVSIIDDTTIAVADGDTISRYGLKGNRIDPLRGKSMIVYGFIRDLFHRDGMFITRLLVGDKSLTYHGTRQIISQNRDSVDLMHFDSFSGCIIQLCFYDHTAKGYTLDGKEKWTVFLEGGPIAMTSMKEFTLIALHRGSCLLTSQGQVLPAAMFSSKIDDINALTWQEVKDRLLLVTHSRDHVMVFSWSK